MEPSSALWLVLLVSIGILGIYALRIYTKNDIPYPKVPPVVTTAAPKPVTTTTTLKRKAETPPAPTPFSPVYSYVSKNQSVRCRTCDGENPLNSSICCICGSNVKM